MNEPTVDILLASFNGEQFIAEQIESILHQSYPNIRLIIGDDESFDGTGAIIRRYAEKYPDKILPIFFDENVGVTQNFSRLADYAEAPYVMLADQDDIWFPKKVEITLKAMLEAEALYGEEMPLLVHTDNIVIDNAKNVLAKSFRKYSDINPSRTLLRQVLMQNVALGCTIMINKRLLDLSFPVPTEADVHDYWIGLVASVFGKFVYIDRPTLYYRQHGNNIYGAYRHRLIPDLIEILRNPQKSRGYSNRMYSKAITAFIFYKRYESSLSDKDKKVLERFITLRNRAFIQEAYARIRYGFFRGDIRKEILDFVCVYLCGPVPEKYRLKL
jgi:glycosyltransferase involved in cell wall biosynthesis